MFKGVDQNLAVLMVILGGLLPATLIDFFNVLNDAAALVLVRGGDFLSVFDKPQRDALAMLFLRSVPHRQLRFGAPSRQRLPHHLPMHAQFLRDRANRTSSMRMFPPDLFEWLHLASPVHRPPRLLRRQRRPIYRLGWGQM